jgi:hypothetical protein
LQVGSAAHALVAQPKVYLMTCEAFNLKPAQVMMCAAHSGDLSSAQKLGLRTAISIGRERVVRAPVKPNRADRSMSWARTSTTLPTSLGYDGIHANVASVLTGGEVIAGAGQRGHPAGRRSAEWRQFDPTFGA